MLSSKKKTNQRYLETLLKVIGDEIVSDDSAKMNSSERKFFKHATTVENKKNDDYPTLSYHVLTSKEWDILDKALTNSGPSGQPLEKKMPRVSFFYNFTNKKNSMRSTHHRCRSIAYVWDRNSGLVFYGASIFTDQSWLYPQRRETWTKARERNTAYGRLRKRPIVFKTDKKNHRDVREEIRKHLFTSGPRNTVRRSSVVLNEKETLESIIRSV